MTARPGPSSRRRSSAVVTAATGAASAEHELDPRVGQRRIDRQIRRPGLEHRQDRHDRLGRPARTATPHTGPGRHPCATNKCANRFDASSSSRYVIERPSNVTATASGVTRHLRGEQLGIDAAACRLGSTPPGCRIASSRACSAASSTSIDDSRRAGSAVIASAPARNRSIRVSMLAASNTSVRNSTSPPIPAGSPLSVQRSASENVRSIRAVWVSTGSG